MFERFGDNRVLATAAYNAGPHRVEKWLPQEKGLDARIWIENFHTTKRGATFAGSFLPTRCFTGG